ncbi:MAG: tetratricopeptide repeat-containing sensor histidine kinase [Bacteroidota bacterium]
MTKPLIIFTVLLMLALTGGRCSDKSAADSTLAAALKVTDHQSRLNALFRGAITFRDEARLEKPFANAFWHIQKQQPNDTNRAKGLYLLADVELSEGAYENCLSHCLEALKPARRRNMYYLQAEILADISGIYFRNDDLDESLETIKEAAEIAHTHKSHEQEARMLELLSIRYFLKGRKTYAIRLLDSALAVTKKGKPGQVFDILINKAKMLALSGEPEKALRIYKQSLPANGTLTTDQKAFSLTSIARIYLKLKQPVEAKKSFEQALAIADQIGDPDYKLSVYDGLFRAELMMGNIEKADEAHLRYEAQQDSVHSRQKRELLADLRAKYDSDLKDSKLSAQSEQLNLNRKINIGLAVLVLMAAAIGMILYMSRQRIRRLYTENSRQKEELTLQKEELSRINLLKDKLFSTISHDLRAPINTLISAIYLLESQSAEPEKLAMYMRHLKAGLGYTSDLMTNLLEFARSQMNGLNPKMEPIELPDVVNEVAQLYRTALEQKNITLTQSIPAHLKVYADENMLAVIIRNLLSNALKFTPPAGEIEISATEADKGHISLSVTDSGRGISQADVTAFNSAEDDLQPLSTQPGTDGQKGTGLGLMLSKSMAAAMKGSVSLESEPGSGASFKVHLQHAGARA